MKTELYLKNIVCVHYLTIGWGRGGHMLVIIRSFRGLPTPKPVPYGKNTSTSLSPCYYVNSSPSSASPFVQVKKRWKAQRSQALSSFTIAWWKAATTSYSQRWKRATSDCYKSSTLTVWSLSLQLLKGFLANFWWAWLNVGLQATTVPHIKRVSFLDH